MAQEYRLDEYERQELRRPARPETRLEYLPDSVIPRRRWLRRPSISNVLDVLSVGSVMVAFILEDRGVPFWVSLLALVGLAVFVRVLLIALAAAKRFGRRGS